MLDKASRGSPARFFVTAIVWVHQPDSGIAVTKPGFPAYNCRIDFANNGIAKD
jgi:hypothetical protein